MKTKSTLFIISSIIIISTVYPQSGTFDFDSGTTSGSSVTQTISTITLTMTSDGTSSSMTTQDWTQYESGSTVYHKNVVTSNGVAKPYYTLTFSANVNIASLVVATFSGANQHLKFTPNNGSAYDFTVNGTNGSIVNVNFIHITSIKIEDYSGGTVNLGVDNVIMDASLPVELTSFTALANGNSVALNWTTATEINNYGFQIESKKEKVESKKEKVESNWETIGFVKGCGNSNSPKEYLFVDKTPPGGKVQYRLLQIDNDGSFKYYGPVEVLLNIALFSLKQNYPNPFNPVTTISYSLPEKTQVNLAVYDVLGRKVASLVNKEQESGVYDVEFDGSNLNSGIYFYELHAGQYSEVKKLLLVK